MVVEASVTARSTGHVSRVAITNSREDLTSTRTTSPEGPKNVSSVHKKSVTKINIGSGLVADAVVPPIVENVSELSRSKSIDVQRQKTADVKRPTQIESDEVSCVDNNNVITKTKGHTVSSLRGSGVSPQPEVVNPHTLVDKRNSNGSSTTTTSVSKTSSANLSGSYHHLHHLSEV